MMNCLNKMSITRKHIFVISLIYFLTNWFILILSGRWWDDWVYYACSFDYIKEVFWQSSVPLEAFILEFFRSLPDGSYRIVVFFLFYFGSILVYLTMRRMKLFSAEECFWITALYVTAPINDYRVTLICIGYSIGLFAYWLSFYWLVVWTDLQGYKRKIYRVLSVAMLLFAFITESIMALTVLMLLYLYYLDYKANNNFSYKNISFMMKSFLRSVIHYIDYLLAPVIYYFGKRALFPGYGIYGGHNYVTMDGLLNAIETFPRICINFIRALCSSYLHISDAFVIFFAIACILIWFKCNSEHEENDKKIICFFIVGLLSFVIGFFPYAIVGKAGIPNDRNAMLLGIGIAFTIYNGLSLIVRQKCKAYLLSIVVIGGALCLNSWYFEWQRSWYYQLMYQKSFSDSAEIRKYNTFLFFPDYPAKCDRFYQVQGNAYVATGTMDRFIMTSIHDLSYITKFDEDDYGLKWFVNAYNMENYDLCDLGIDCIIYLHNKNLSKKDVISLKRDEMLNGLRFKEQIDSMVSADYIVIDKELSQQIFDEYKEGKLNKKRIAEIVGYKK